MLKADLKPVQSRTEIRADRDHGSQEFRYGWIGPNEALRHLGLHSLSALYRLIKEWELPFGRMGNRYRFRRADLDHWITVRGGSALAAVERNG